MVNSIIAIFLGYLLGSILPAYFLSRWLKGIDIRKVGTGNAGTTNVIKTIGVIPAIPTAIYDVSKGILAIIIARQIFNTSLIIAYLSCFAAILGHIFPFYIGFRGGQGAASATGLLLYNLYQLFFISKSQLVILDLVLLILTIIIMIIISHIQELIAITVLPLFGFFLIYRLPPRIEVITSLIIITYLFALAIYNIIKFNLYTIDYENYPDFRLWRTLLRPAAMAFPILSFFISKSSLITLIGTVLVIFFITDVVRILHKRVGRFFLHDIRRSITIYKDKEQVRISSMTLFLLGCFLSFLLFERTIAFCTMVFLIFGDLSAKMLGLAYGKHKLFNKTLEGSLAHLLACLVLGYILHLFVYMPTSLIFVGAFVATIVEVLPFNIDDNLSVPVITGAILTIGLQLVK